LKTFKNNQNLILGAFLPFLVKKYTKIVRTRLIAEQIIPINNNIISVIFYILEIITDVTM
jgi:hypothetical protein